MTWALMESFRRQDVRVQHFVARACFPEHPAAAAITGLRTRYLDSWLMDEMVCRELFASGSEPADLSLIEGDFRRPDTTGQGWGGDLETLCQWLRVPRIVLLDASRIAGGFPQRPANVDGVLLDQVGDQPNQARLSTDVETAWGVPVVGSLPAAPEFGRRLAGLLPGESPPADLVRDLGDHLTQSWRPETLHRLSRKDSLPPLVGRLFQVKTAALRLTVAVAFDEAFCQYFPCALDMLEACGATVVDFSPLRDEHLPADCDIVLLGGGYPERYASMLSDNHCMKTALRNHVRWGRRIYGEGAGLAFLCQQMATADGELARMAGLLPATARLLEPSSAPVPVESTLWRPNWMGHAGVRVRGYRNPRWTLDPSNGLDGFLFGDEYRLDMMGTFQVISSLLEVHFGTQPNLLNHFFYPHRPTPPDVDPW
ncbi:MAG: hypothetical protein JW888_08130 [Pirellulales bacterium]|nr:hypothetical protein [Pirellulales bacterium]